MNHEVRAHDGRTGVVSDREIVLAAEDAKDVAAIARALPDPTKLDPGTRISLLASTKEAPSLTTRLFAALGRGKPPGVPCAWRCTALGARGYVRVGAADGRAWGFAPDDAAPEPM